MDFFEFRVNCPFKFERQSSMMQVKHCQSRSLHGSSLLGALAAALALLLCVAGGSDGAGQGYSTDGATGHLSAGHLVLDRWR